MTSNALSPRVLMAGGEIEATLERMAREILGQADAPDELVLVGIQSGGAHVARQLAGQLERMGRRPVTLGQIDVAMHRDDLDERLAPVVHPTTIPFDISGKPVILVDDVLCSGRTSRAALDALTDLGRPQRVQLAVLIDRGRRELPIHADFVGRRVDTEPDDRVDVQFTADHQIDRVVMERHAANADPP